jgi:mRNA interferase YafQ
MPSAAKGAKAAPVLPRIGKIAKAFQKDWAAAAQSGRHDMARVKQVMTLLIANDGPLAPEWLDHGLKGQDWAGARECHVKGDLLLVYTLGDEPKGQGTVEFVRLGTHSELFGG